MSVYFCKTYLKCHGILKLLTKLFVISMQVSSALAISKNKVSFSEINVSYQNMLADIIF